MILRSIRVENWRCFVNPVEVGTFGDGLNVLHGSNGIGKSTLLWALVRGFFDNHGVTGKAVEALRPWDRSLGPTVTMEFQHEEERFRLTKRFLNSPSAELSRLEDAQFTRLAEGDEADRQVREKVRGGVPTRGLTNAQHWGLAQVLWAPQGQLSIPELSDNIASDIRASLGAQVADPRTETIEKKVREAYERIYTRTGKLKSGRDAPRVVGDERELGEAQESEKRLRDKVAEFENASRRIEDLKSLKHQASRNEEQLDKDLEKARKRAQSYKDILSNRDKLEETARAAKARYSELEQRINNIKAAARDLKDAQKELDQLQADAPLQVKEVQQRRQEAARAKSELEKIRTRRKDVDAARRKAERAARFVENQRTFAATEELIDKITAAHKEREELKNQRNRLVAPDASTLQAIRHAVDQCNNIQVKLNAALITVSVAAERDVDLEVLSAEQTGQQRVPAGGSWQVQGSPEVAFRIPGLARFRATGPTGSVEELREQLADATKNLDALTEGFGTRDIEQLEQLHERARALDKAISEIAVKVDTLLADRRLEEIQQERARAAQLVEGGLKEYPQWSDSPPHTESLYQEASEIDHTFRADIDEAEPRWEQANIALSSASEKMASHQKDLKNLQRRMTLIRHQLEELTNDGQDDSQRAADLQRRAMEWNAAEGGVEKANEELTAFAGDPCQEVEVLQRQLDEARKGVSTTTSALGEANGQLQQLVSLAPYSELSKVEERISDLQDSIAREGLRNNAMRLLFETIKDCRSSAVKAVVGPVEQRATNTLHRIAGSRLGSIKFEDSKRSFLPEEVAPVGVEQPVPIGELSGGEKEQVHLAVRLALADVLFQGERQLVVLDDVLTSSDTARLARILTILEEAADKFQILILTCHPERYRGLARAEFFDLEGIVTASRTAAAE